MTDNQQRARVLVVGADVGAMCSYALDQGGKAEVTAVLRSNYDAVEKDGFEVDSVQYGRIPGWRPASIRKTIPSVATEPLPPFDFILVTTKNTPDIPPPVSEIIAPAVTPGHTVIILAQNGLNLEGPVISAFPSNPILSSVRIAEDAAKRWIAVYNPDERLETLYDPDVKRARWRKLIYIASYNPIIREIMAAAEACGVTGFPEDLPEIVIRGDPVDTEFKPSMAQDAEKGGFMEIENIVGEPLREGMKRGVDMPTLRTVYGLLKGLQLKVKETRGLWAPGFEEGHPYP
ncbi:6-phosphogluconate dehydrogenase [Aspergillus desertorum]